MKILYSINCYNAIHHQTAKQLNYQNNGGIIWALAWKRFLDRHRSEIKGDFMFLDGTFDPLYFADKLSGERVEYLDLRGSTPDDADMTYTCLRLGEGYDYIVRVDQDSFPTVKSLATIHSFLEQNQDIDILSPGNTFQSITIHPPNQPTRVICGSEDGNWCPGKEAWYPWGHITLGNCIVYMRREYFRNALGAFIQHPMIQHPHSGHASDDRPFIRKALTFKQICDTLHKECIPGLEDASVNIDGQISSDFWTIMCMLGMKSAYIANYDGQSWKNKDHLNYDPVSDFQSFDEVVDHPNNYSMPVGFPIVRAPFFHMGASGNTTYLFDSYTHPGRCIDHWNDFFGDNWYNRTIKSFGVIAHSVAITRMLVDATQDKELQEQFYSNLTRVCKETDVSWELFEQLCEKVDTVYYQPLKEYLGE